MSEVETVTQRRREILAIVLTGLVVLGFVGWLIYTPAYSTPAVTSVPVFTDGDLVTPNDGSPLPAPQAQLVRQQMAAAQSLGTVVDPLVFATGVSGTYIVPRGYVVGLSAIASANPDGGLDSGGVGATVTITPNGPGITDGAAVTQPPILIPAGYNWSIGRPVIQGNANEMGTGTTIVFYGTQTYTVVMSLGGS